MEGLIGSECECVCKHLCVFGWKLNWRQCNPAFPQRNLGFYPATLGVVTVNGSADKWHNKVLVHWHYVLQIVLEVISSKEKPIKERWTQWAELVSTSGCCHQSSVSFGPREPKQCHLWPHIQMIWGHKVNVAHCVISAGEKWKKSHLK